MSKEEQLADLEESIMMNSSSVGDKGRRRGTMPAMKHHQEIGLMDFGQINREQQLQTDLIDLKLEIQKKDDYIKQLVAKLKKYKSEMKKKE